METHLTSWGDLRLFITGILEPPGGEQMVSSPASTLELELEVLGSGILLVCVGIFSVLIAAQYSRWQCLHSEQIISEEKKYFIVKFSLKLVVCVVLAENTNVLCLSTTAS